MNYVNMQMAQVVLFPIVHIISIIKYIFPYQLSSRLIRALLCTDPKKQYDRNIFFFVLSTLFSKHVSQDTVTLFVLVIGQAMGTRSSTANHEWIILLLILK